MFIALIEFNRLLNIRSYIRKVGGKMVRVKSHKKQAVLRAHDAAEDLLKQLNADSKEFAYIISKSGKVSKLYKGDAVSVDLKGHYKNAFMYVHNHPKKELFAPSIPDILSTVITRSQAAIVVPGYKSRFYLKNKSLTTKDVAFSLGRNTYKDYLQRVLTASDPSDITSYSTSRGNLYTLTNNNDFFFREYGPRPLHEGIVISDFVHRLASSSEKDLEILKRHLEKNPKLVRRLKERLPLLKEHVEIPYRDKLKSKGEERYIYGSFTTAVQQTRRDSLYNLEQLLKDK